MTVESIAIAEGIAGLFDFVMGLLAIVFFYAIYRFIKEAPAGFWTSEADRKEAERRVEHYHRTKRDRMGDGSEDSLGGHVDEPPV